MAPTQMPSSQTLRTNRTIGKHLVCADDTRVDGHSRRDRSQTSTVTSSSFAFRDLDMDEPVPLVEEPSTSDEVNGIVLSDELRDYIEECKRPLPMFKQYAYPMRF